MKIVFLVPRHEPGKDGVGDVTRRLAMLLRQRGIEATLVSWNDSITGIFKEGYRFKKQEAWEDQGIPKLLKELQPDWVSFQFIHYAFDSKGFMFQWTPKIVSALRPFRIHLFLHEIWVGVHHDATWKHRLLGTVQKWGILQLMRKLKPERIQTSNLTYSKILENNGVDSEVTKHVSGIIPVSRTLPDAKSGFEIEKKLGPWRSKRLEMDWVMLFGAIHPEARLDLFLNKMVLKKERPFLLISIGRQTPGEVAWKQYQTEFKNKIDFVTLGEAESEQVSLLMRECDWGITTTPYQIIGKSSVVVAMLEHGLPVIAYRDQRYGEISDHDRSFHPGVMGPEEVEEKPMKNWTRRELFSPYEVESSVEKFLKVLNRE